MTSVFSKLFSLVLDNRLRLWAESNNILSDYQYGFRKNRSTVDCIFVLYSIINRIINHEKKTLYASFIDFQKCFDLLYRNGIWYKLIQSGISSKIVKMLRSMYSVVKSCVKVNGELTDYFDSYMGVKQGEPLSPFLFSIFVNDMYECIEGDNLDAFTLGELQIFLLLFADDTVLFSYSSEGLQILLNKLNDYCKTWCITVNVEKSAVMVFKKGNTNITNMQFQYEGKNLSVVKSFTYLGVKLSSNGNMFQTQKVLSEQAMKALFSLNSLFDSMPLGITEKIKLFDSIKQQI